MNIGAMNDKAVLAEIGRRVQVYRLNLNLTQAAVAEKAGVSRRALQKLEYGEACTLSTLKRELNQLRRTGVAGENLLKHLIRIYDQHSLKDATARRSLDAESRVVPRIICSEAFV